MRITNRMIQQSTLRDLGLGAEALARAQRRAASGRRIETLSDDPVDATAIMRIESGLRDVDQFRRNAAAARTRLSAEDAVLTNVRELLGRAKALAIASSSLDPADPARLAALAEVRLIREQVVSLGNTRIGGEYIFAGGQTTAPAFQPNGTYAGDFNVRRAALNESVTVATNDPGAPVLSDSLVALADLELELQSGNSTTIQATLAGLVAAQDNVLVKQAEVGARLRQIEDVSAGLAQRAAGMLDHREAMRDVDPAEAIVQVTAAQSALERAYAVVSRVLSASLVDYLR